MTTHASPFPGRPLLVCGMHRSGTSLTASLLHAAGVRLGDRLLGADRGNDRGHFEDLEIYEFHQAVLRSNGLGTEGFVAAGSVAVPDPLEPVGRRLAADRARAGGVWGWKEPRTVLFLDYWDAILNDARYVFVFRRPWEVVDSLFRRGDETFAGNPAFAAAVWLHYNRTILEFVRKHESRCLVREVDQVAADPHGLCAAVRAHLGIGLGDPSARYEEQLLIRDASPPHAAAIRACLPEAHDVYLELCARAGTSPDEGRGQAASEPAALGRGLLGEWRQTRRAEARVAELIPQVLASRAATATAEATATALRGRITDLEAEVSRLEAVGAEWEQRIAALEAERMGHVPAAVAVRELDREIAALRGELHEREAVLAWTAARLGSREGSVLRRVGREVRRVGRQFKAALRKLWPRKAATVQAGQSDDRRDAA